MDRNLHKKIKQVFSPEELQNKLNTDIDALFNSIDDDTSPWQFKPVSPDRFVLDKEYFGDSKDNGIFPHVIEDLCKIFSAENYFPAYRTVLFIGSPGDGKSTTISFALAYYTYLLHCLKNPFKYFQLKDISRIALMGMAPKGDSAKKIVFEKASQIIHRTQWFRDNNFLPDESIKSELRFLKRPVTIVPGNSSQNFPAGHDVLAGIIDEAQLFIEKYHDPCKDLYEDMKSRAFSRFGENALIFLAANANMDENFIETLYDRAKDDPTIYAKRRGVYINPNKFCGLTFKVTVKRERIDGQVERTEIDIPVELENEFKTNEREAIKKWCAVPNAGKDPFIENWDRVLDVVNRNRECIIEDTGDFIEEHPLEQYARIPDSFRGTHGVNYYIHIDLATGGKNGKGCACGFSMGHRGPDVEQLGVKLPTAYIDLVTRFKGSANKQIDFEEVRQFVQFLKQRREFNIVKCTFDGWNSWDSIQSLERAGYIAEIAGANKDCYGTMKTMLYSGRVDFYYHKVLMRELKRLEKMPDGGCDHGPMGSKDVSDSFARVCYMVTEGAAADLELPEEVKQIVRPPIHRPIMGTAQSHRSNIPNLNKFSGPNLPFNIH